MADVIAALNKPTLVIVHNKPLAGQLYGEFKEFFLENAVEYFASYYIGWILQHNSEVYMAVLTFKVAVIEEYKPKRAVSNSLEFKKVEKRYLQEV